MCALVLRRPDEPANEAEFVCASEHVRVRNATARPMRIAARAVAAAEASAAVAATAIAAAGLEAAGSLNSAWDVVAAEAVEVLPAADAVDVGRTAKVRDHTFPPTTVAH